jgi:hypothetical protein
MGKIYDVKVELVRKTKEQYESDRVALSATAEDGEDIATLISDMKAVILGQIGAKALVGSTLTEKVEIKKTLNVKQAGSSIPEEKPHTTKEVESGEPTNSSSPKDQETSSEKAPKESSSKKAAKKSDSEKSSKEDSGEETPSEEEVVEPKNTRIKAKKTVNYDRELATHKDMLGEFLDKSVGKKWRAGVLLAKAAKTSGALHKEGTPFLDGEGNVLESFTSEFLKRFEAE